VNELRRKWNRFLYNNGDKGIPNLMLWVSIGTLLVYFFMIVDPSNVIYQFIRFDRRLILQGQVWRLLTYIFVPNSSGIWLFLLLFAYYGIGRMVESVWGTLKFNLFYLCGIVIMDIGALLLGTTASSYYLNLSLFLALATMFPDNKVLLMYIIPLKMKYLAWFYLLLMVYDVIGGDFSSVLALMNYFLFFGRECRNVLPGADRVGSKRMDFRFRHKNSSRPNPNWASSYKSKKSDGPKKVVDAPAYRHKCTVCGRTDVSNPELEFRYCSRCNGYYCYCQDHINNHAHIE
jgi:membrane associated rhomboid family serine protease